MSGESCPGCGDELREVGAMALMQVACCDAVSYALCPTCADAMRRGGQRERTELLARIELNLATEGSTAQ